MEVEKIVQRQVIAYNNRDLEQFCSCFSEDIQLFNYQEEIPTLVGKKALIESYKDVFENSPELDAKIINRIVFDNKVIDHEQVTGRKGIPFIDVVVIYELKDDLINKVTYIKLGA